MKMLGRERLHHCFDVIGAEREKFLTRISTRHVGKISFGESRLSAILTAEARIRALFWIERSENALRLYAPPEEGSRLIEALQFYHFAEDVQWSESSPAEVGVEETTDGETWNGIKFHFRSSAPAESLTPSEWDQLRISKLLVERGKDFSDSENVFDLGLEWICDENKGCYVGQEVVERVRSRGGKPPRILARVVFAGEPQAGEEMLIETEKVGQLTRSISPLSGRYQALSFIQRKFCQIGNKIIAKSSNLSGELVGFWESPKSS